MLCPTVLAMYGFRSPLIYPESLLEKVIGVLGKSGKSIGKIN